MTSDRILTLHQEASEHYLNGRYDEAVAAWKAVLAIDPSNDEALEGVRMSSLLASGESEERVPVETAVEEEIDAGLRVFEFGSGEAPAPPAEPTDAASTGDLPDPERQSEGIDFGDLADVNAIPLAPPNEELELLPDAPEIPEVEETGLVAVTPTPLGEDPAVRELKHRIESLLAEARAKKARGDTEAALAVLARVQLLDEENEDARALESELRDAGTRHAEEIEQWIIEGVSAVEAGRFDDARGWFVKVLERSPEHREAQHYLAEVAKRSRGPAATEASAEEADAAPEFLSNATPPPPAAEDLVESLGLSHVEARLPAEEIVPIAPRRPAADLPTVAVAPSRPRWLWPVLAIVALVAIAAGGWAAFRGEVSAEAASAPATTGPPKPAEEPPPATAAKPSVSAASLEASLARGRRALAAGDVAAAVVAFDEALKADPTSEEARDGMTKAAAAYKEGKAEREQLDKIRMAFEDGEFASALRLVYRLPAIEDPAAVERWKVNGWFNLGVVALRAGEAPQAIQHFDEALSLRPDAGAKRWREFADRYRTARKDRAYYDAVEAIPFRGLDD